MGLEYIKCTKCNGTGLVQIGPNIRGLKKCPWCHGTGKRVVKTENNNK